MSEKPLAGGRNYPGLEAVQSMVGKDTCAWTRVLLAAWIVYIIRLVC